jgi:glycine/D-amino acid oxidase-like deaminating enzyme
MYMLEEAKNSGVKLLVGKVVDIKCKGEQVAYVCVEVKGKIHKVHCGSFVNAAGPFATSVAEILGIQLPLFSVYQQKLAFQDLQGIIPGDSPFTIFMDDQHIHWSCEEQDLLARETEYHWMLERFPGGLHVRPEGKGDSAWIKLGWAINRTASSPTWDPACSLEFPDIVVRGATCYIPGLSVYADNLPQPVIQYGGYYTKTDDNLPLIGPMGISGAYVVGGLSGYGTMTACAAGELCAAWVSESTLPDYAKFFSLERYSVHKHAPAQFERVPSGEL